MRNPKTGAPVKTAGALLNSYLTPKQRKTYKEHRVVFVTSTGRYDRGRRRLYALTDGQYVFVMYEGKPHDMLHVWAHTIGSYRYNLPAEGSVLAQLLFIQCNLEYLVDTACHNSVPDVWQRRIMAAGPPPMAGFYLIEDA